jgi:hypothetical protein
LTNLTAVDESACCGRPCGRAAIVERHVYDPDDLRLRNGSRSLGLRAAAIVGQEIGEVPSRVSERRHVDHRLRSKGPLKSATASDKYLRRVSTSCGPYSRYLTSVSSLNIGRYMLMMMMPTMIPTPTIISGSMIEVRAAIDASTSSS